MVAELAAQFTKERCHCVNTLLNTLFAAELIVWQPLCGIIAEELSEKVRAFFRYLFEEEECPNKPLENRRYIIITRKGFSLWLAGVFCGMISEASSDPNKLISDRKWNKMTVRERNAFVKDHDIFIADDSVITGASAQNIYLSIDLRYVRSRSVAFLTSDFHYGYEKMFSNYKDFGSVTVDQRREQNERILFALYQIPVPFTAESPVYYNSMLETTLEDWKSAAIAKGWTYEEMHLDFGVAGVTSSTPFFHAPLNVEKFGANVLLCGMRMCMRKHSDSCIEVFFVPWVLFDAIDYDKAIEYLFDLLENAFKERCKETWLYTQLTEGEPDRKQNVVHRVISYLYDTCVLEEFEDAIGERLASFKLYDKVDLLQYHFNDDLFNEIRTIQEYIHCTQNCPAKQLLMKHDKHDQLVLDLCSMSYYKLDIPKRPQHIAELEDRLCAQREITINKDTGVPIFPSRTKRHPLICYTGEDRGTFVLNFVRRAIASFRSDIISYTDSNGSNHMYLLNTLLPGEGSPLAFVKNYDFIYALHRFASTDKYSRGKERAFAKEWEALRASDSTLSSVTSTMVDTLENISREYWPSQKTIMEKYNVDPYLMIRDVAEQEEVFLKSTELTRISTIVEGIASKFDISFESEDDPIAFFSQLSE